MEVFNIIRYKKYAHHKTSVLSGLSCSLFDFIQVAVSSAHSVTCDESASIHIQITDEFNTSRCMRIMRSISSHSD